MWLERTILLTKTRDQLLVKSDSVGDENNLCFVAFSVARIVVRGEASTLRRLSGLLASHKY